MSEIVAATKQERTRPYRLTPEAISTLETLSRTFAFKFNKNFEPSETIKHLANFYKENESGFHFENKVA